jgi:hypothetical protein
MVHFGPPDRSLRRAALLEARDSFVVWQKSQSSPRVHVLRGMPRAADAPLKAVAIPVFQGVDGVIDALLGTTDR